MKYGNNYCKMSKYIANYQSIAISIVSSDIYLDWMCLYFSVYNTFQKIEWYIYVNYWMQIYVLYSVCLMNIDMQSLNIICNFGLINLWLFNLLAYICNINILNIHAFVVLIFCNTYRIYIRFMFLSIIIYYNSYFNSNKIII